jgi:Mce-associated membrane protein
VSKHSEDQTVEEETTVAPTDTETEQADEVDKADEPTETADETSESAEPEKPKRSIQWARVFAFGVLPAVALLLAMGAGYLKWMDNSVRDSERARDTSVQAAKDSTVALLSYKPDTVEQQLNAARDRLTGDFRDSYTSLTHDVVIPGAKQKQISAVATVPAAASVSANPNQAVVLVFVNQTVIVGQDAPTDTASSVRVTLDKVGDRWLIAKFDPV